MNRSTSNFLNSLYRLTRSLEHELIRAERTITGHGAANGGMRVLITNPSSISPVDFVFFESLPWFMRPYIHTLDAQITRTEFPYDWTVIRDMYYRPALDRERGSQLELVMSIPPASTVMLTYDFEKAILRYTEYPPDANRGFNVAPAVIRVLNQTEVRSYTKRYLHQDHESASALTYA